MNQRPIGQSIGAAFKVELRDNITPVLFDGSFRYTKSIRNLSGTGLLGNKF